MFEEEEEKEKEGGEKEEEVFSLVVWHHDGRCACLVGFGGLCIQRTEVFDRFGEVCCPSRKLNHFRVSVRKVFSLLFSSLLFSLFICFLGQKGGRDMGEGYSLNFLTSTCTIFYLIYHPAPIVAAISTGAHTGDAEARLQ